MKKPIDLLERSIKSFDRLGWEYISIATVKLLIDQARKNAKQNQHSRF